MYYLVLVAALSSGHSMVVLPDRYTKEECRDAGELFPHKYICIPAPTKTFKVSGQCGANEICQGSYPIEGVGGTYGASGTNAGAIGPTVSYCWNEGSEGKIVCGGRQGK